jgi:hypothetical protein
MADRDDQPKRGASKQIRAQINRIEDNDVAVLMVGDDAKTQLDFPRALLPEGADEGDHLRINISLDKESKDAASDRVKKLQDKLAQAGSTEGQTDFKL